MERLRAAWPATLGVALLAGLLVVLGTLQYRWITEVSAAEQERRERQLEAGARAFQEDLDQELSRLLLFLYPGLGRRALATNGGGVEAAVAERFALWASSAPRPELVAAVYLAGFESGDRWRRLDPERGRFESVTVPADLEPLRRRIDERGGALARFGPPRFVAAALSIVAPLGPGGRWRGPGPPGRFEARRGDGPEGILVVRLDREVLAGELLPELVERHFGDEFEVEITGPGAQERLLAPAVPSPIAVGEPDLVRPLHLLRPFERLPPGAAAEAGRRPLMAGAPPDLVLVVRHRQGSLHEVVERTRRRNLSVGLGILVLLAGSVVMLLIATLRARRLARRQVEFVASLTHELHTPLAAIGSAAENLADGLVTTPDRVREYGELIGEHGRRLSSLVGQALELAGMAAADSERWEEVDLASVVAAARAASEALRREQGVALEVEVEEDLPPVRGRPESLRLVVENLLRNALKHGASGGVARLRVRRLDSDGQLELEVEDEGPGFAAEDLPHVFEPFYRGRSAARRPGSGLGLRLVEQIVKRHGGSVEAGNRSGGGAVVTVRLPFSREVSRG